MIPDIKQKIEEMYPLPDHTHFNNIYDLGIATERVIAIRSAAIHGYSLSQQEIENKDKEIDLLEAREVAWANKVSQLNEEIVRLKGLIEWLWLQHNPHSNFFGHTDGEKIKQQKRFLQKFITENNIEDAAIYTGNSLK